MFPTTHECIWWYIWLLTVAEAFKIAPSDTISLINWHLQDYADSN